MANLGTETRWKEATGRPPESLPSLLHAFPFFRGTVAYLFVPSPLCFPHWHKLSRKAKNSSHLTQIRGWMHWGFITHWLKRVLWERMGYIIIVSLVTSTHPARKMVGLPLFRHHFTKGPSSSLPLFLISLEKSACRPGSKTRRGSVEKGSPLPPSCLEGK